MFVDGVIAGEGNGPMDPDPVAAGLMLFGFHPASTDAACAAVMGFEPQRIPIVRQAFLCRFLPLTNWALSDVALSTTTEPGRRHPIGALPAELIHCFKPHFGWVGEVEARAK